MSTPMPAQPRAKAAAVSTRPSPQPRSRISWWGPMSVGARAVRSRPGFPVPIGGPLSSLLTQQLHELGHILRLGGEEGAQRPPLAIGLRYNSLKKRLIESQQCVVVTARNHTHLLSLVDALIEVRVLHCCVGAGFGVGCVWVPRAGRTLYHSLEAHRRSSLGTVRRTPGSWPAAAASGSPPPQSCWVCWGLASAVRIVWAAHCGGRGVSVVDERRCRRAIIDVITHIIIGAMSDVVITVRADQVLILMDIYREIHRERGSRTRISSDSTTT